MLRMIQSRVFIFVAFCFFCSWAAAQDQDTSSSADQTMETITVSDGYKMIIPKGAKVEKIGGQIKVQDQGEVLFYKVAEQEERLTAFNIWQEEFEKRMEALRRETAQMLQMLKDILEKADVEQKELKEAVKELTERFDFLRDEQDKLWEQLNAEQPPEAAKEE